MIAGHFNLYHISSDNVAEVDPLIQDFDLSQSSQYSTQIYGGLLDYRIIVFDTLNFKFFLLYHDPTEITLFFFSKSDHYINRIQLLAI